MTYRRLFHILLIGSTIMLAAVWRVSFITGVGWQTGASKVPLMLEVNFIHASVELTVHSMPSYGWYLDFWSAPVAEFAPGEKPELTGVFEWIDLSSRVLPYGTTHAIYRLTFPMWVLYLLFVSSALAFCRVMERRARKT